MCTGDLIVDSVHEGESRKTPIRPAAPPMARSVSQKETTTSRSSPHVRLDVDAFDIDSCPNEHCQLNAVTQLTCISNDGQLTVVELAVCAAHNTITTSILHQQRIVSNVIGVAVAEEIHDVPAARALAGSLDLHE